MVTLALLFFLFVGSGSGSGDAPCLLFTSNASLRNTADEVVCAEDVSSVEVPGHLVSKAGDVAGGLKSGGRSQDGSIELKHMFLYDEMFA